MGLNARAKGLTAETEFNCGYITYGNFIMELIRTAYGEKCYSIPTRTTKGETMNSPCEDCRRNCEEPCWKVEHGALVEVVRCEYCKHLLRDLSARKYHMCMRLRFPQRVNLDDFCSYGERSNNELDKR